MKVSKAFVPDLVVLLTWYKLIVFCCYVIPLTLTDIFIFHIHTEGEKRYDMSLYDLFVVYFDKTQVNIRIQYWKLDKTLDLESLLFWLSDRFHHFQMPYFTTFQKQTSFNVQWDLDVEGLVQFTAFYKVSEVHVFRSF